MHVFGSVHIWVPSLPGHLSEWGRRLYETISHGPSLSFSESLACGSPSRVLEISPHRASQGAAMHHAHGEFLTVCNEPSSGPKNEKDERRCAFGVSYPARKFGLCPRTPCCEPSSFIRADRYPISPHLHQIAYQMPPMPACRLRFRPLLTHGSSPLYDHAHGTPLL